MLKIGILGLAGILLALLIREVKPGFAVLISMATCVLIFYYGIDRLSYVAQAAKTLQEYIRLQDSYLKILLKMVGITYIADFSASLCKSPRAPEKKHSQGKDSGRRSFHVLRSPSMPESH